MKAVVTGGAGFIGSLLTLIRMAEGVASPFCGKALHLKGK